MRRVLRWLAWIVGGFVGLVVLAFVVSFAFTEYRIRQTYDIEVAPVVIPTDAASIEFGRQIGTTWAACTVCHGDQLEGMVEEGPEGVFAPPNLTSGEGGIGDAYRDEDWVRAIRYGIKPNGRANLFMLGELSNLSDEELGAVIAWARSVPPVDNVLPDTSLGLMGRLFLLLEPGFVLPAAEIDHESLPRPAPSPGATAAYGEHIARTICVVCHLDDFAGGAAIPGTDDVEKVSRNLTPAGNLADWTEADFVAAMTSGITPEGDVLDPEAMPWDYFSGLTDEELQALWLFLQTLPPVSPDEDN